MIELKVTGENVEHFRANLDEFLAAMLKMQRRGAIIGQKIEERKKVHSDRADDLFMEQKTSDPAPKVAGTKASSTEKKTKGPKLDDLKTRLSEVIVAATARWDQKRANAYARKLLKEFAVEKLSELRAEEYGAFMHGSNPYLSGDIAE